MSLRRKLLFVVVVIALAATMYSQSKKPITKRGLSATKVSCVTGTFSFKCPDEFRVLLSGKSVNRLFSAYSGEFRYGVFAVFDPNENSMAESLPKIMKAFQLKGSREFEWKDVEADPRRSSKYEVESKRRIAINNPISAYLTLEYRIIEVNGKKLLTGTLVDGYEGPIGIKESFEKGTFTTNGACFDSMDIIATLTKEKLDPEKGPCFFEITITMDK